MEDYQVIRLAGSLTPRATRLAHEAQLDVAPLGKIPHLRTPGLLVMDMDSTAIQIECIDEIAKLAGTGEKVAEVTGARCAASLILPPACAAAWRR